MNSNEPLKTDLTSTDIERNLKEDLPTVIVDLAQIKRISDSIEELILVISKAAVNNIKLTPMQDSILRQVVKWSETSSCKSELPIFIKKIGILKDSLNSSIAANNNP